MSEFDEYTEQIEREVVDLTTRCGRCNACFTQCPLDKSMEGFMTNGPSGLAQSIYYAIKWDLVGEKEEDEILKILYSCTTCNSCVLTCKKSGAGVPVLKIIENGRKLLTEKAVGPLPSQRGVLKSIYTKGNPYNQAPEDRLSWLRDDDVKRLPVEESDVIYYVGCTPSYDPELQDIANSIVKLLKFLEVDFGVLEDERCCGCAANRLGDSFLFEEIASKNIEAFNSCKAKQIITTSPHCYNTFINEYENMGGFKIQHYTELLARYIKGGDLKLKELNYTITYHDPCYLGKHNGIFEEPREILRGIPGVRLMEMRDNREHSLCCGGGGGRMWAEIREENRLSNVRVKQAVSTGADVLAVSCPWCHTMLENAIRDVEVEDRIKVMDVSEILLEALD